MVARERNESQKVKERRKQEHLNQGESVEPDFSRRASDNVTTLRFKTEAAALLLLILVCDSVSPLKADSLFTCSR
jgi:hypothetical protein